MNPSYLRWLRRIALGVAGLVLVVGFALACTFVYLAPSLPTAETMHNVELSVPLRVYTQDGELVSQIGEKRRIPVRFEDIPPLVRQAVLAAEDDRFFEHSGVDPMGFARAAFKVVTSGKAVQGGSTITQQAARQLFLSLDKTLRRKLAELFVTWRMERDFTKEQILATYLNVVFFGQRSYGIASAADTFYNKKLDQLSVAEAATLAGIIQLPSRYNPVTNPKATETRRSYVIGRMLKLGYIDQVAAEAAEKEPVMSRRHAPRTDVEAAYAGELARQYIVAQFGEAAVNAGYKVTLTLNGNMQTAANNALHAGLMDYDQRHGYRGPLAKVKLDAAPPIEEFEDALEKFKPVNLLQPAIVTQVGERSAEVYIREQGPAQIKWEGMAWAKRAVNNGVGPAPRNAGEILKRGDVVFVIPGEPGSAKLSQLPQAQGALVAVDPKNGAIRAMVGGFDFYSNEFNRVTQARRQPGSGFKPFIYSAALDNGFTAASLVLDQPVVMANGGNSQELEELWRPENSNGKFEGQMRLRQGLVLSKNAVSIRILLDMGVEKAIAHAEKFGFDPKSLPRNLTLALGTQNATPLQMATGYAVFANGGFKVDSYLISRVEDAKGKVLFEATPRVACPACEMPDAPDSNSVPADRRAPRTLSAQNAWLTSDIMHDVATQGTGRRTNELGRDDLAGKTGTTQRSRDNWFNGFNSNLVATVWVGYDDERSLGVAEEGSSTAVPIWNLFMREALKGTPSARMPRPAGLVDLRISKATGELADASDPDSIYEVFMVDQPVETSETGEGTDPMLPPVKGPKPAAATGGEPIF